MLHCEIDRQDCNGTIDVGRDDTRVERFVGLATGLTERGVAAREGAGIVLATVGIADGDGEPL